MFNSYDLAKTILDDRLRDAERQRRLRQFRQATGTKFRAGRVLRAFLHTRRSRSDRARDRVSDRALDQARRTATPRLP